MIAYMAHQVRGNAVPGDVHFHTTVRDNLSCAKLWYRYLVESFETLTVIANWIVSVEALDETNPHHRTIGMQQNKNLIRLCDVVFLVGPTISSGMHEEALFAYSSGRPVVNFTYYGLVFPPPVKADPLKGEPWTPNT